MACFSTKFLPDNGGKLRHRTRCKEKVAIRFWVERAKRQVRLTFYRLVFRGFYYPPGKGPLPLPPKSGWQILLNGRPRRGNIDGHDFVLQDYTFRAMILSDTASPSRFGTAARDHGGTWSEPFLLPVDPDLLLERTGYACMDEFEFPPFSVFEQSTSVFLRSNLWVETPDTSACHVTVFPTSLARMRSLTTVACSKRRWTLRGFRGIKLWLIASGSRELLAPAEQI